MRNGFTRWSEVTPPAGVPLKIYCGIKHHVYSRIFTREELEAWASTEADTETVNWSQVGWALTGIAKEMLT
jgi:hypothetical protein